MRALRRCTCPRPGYMLHGMCSKCGLEMRPTAILVTLASLLDSHAGPGSTLADACVTDALAHPNIGAFALAWWHRVMGTGRADNGLCRW